MKNPRSLLRSNVTTNDSQLCILFSVKFILSFYIHFNFAFVCVLLCGNDLQKNNSTLWQTQKSAFRVTGLIKSKSISFMQCSDNAHALFVRATYLVCHRLISSWKTDLNVSLAALELLSGLARLHIKESGKSFCYVMSSSS